MADGIAPYIYINNICILFFYRSAEFNEQKNEIVYLIVLDSIGYLAGNRIYKSSLCIILYGILCHILNIIDSDSCV